MSLKRLDKGLHWTTLYSEKLLPAVIACINNVCSRNGYHNMIVLMKVELGDLFLLFIYAEIVGMVGAFYISNRIPVTLPIIIAMTALCRLIVLHSKRSRSWMLIFEAGAIVLLGGAAYVMSLKDKLSLEKQKLREADEQTD